MAARKTQKEKKNGKGLVKKSAESLRSKAEKKLHEQGGRSKDRSAVRNITKQKKAEEALRASEEKYRSIFEGANDGIISCDLKTGKFLFINKRMSDLTGYSEEEMLKLEVKDLHPPESLSHVLKQFNKMAAGEATEAVDIPVMRKDKSIIYCNIGSSFLGKTTLIGFFRNVTERKRTEEELLHAKEQWERTFASVPDMIAILDNNHRIIRVNESMAKRLGRKPEECVGMKCYEAVHGTTAPPDFCPHSLTIKDGREHTQEVHEERLGMDLLVTTTPLFDEQGKMIASVHVAHDITQRKKIETELLEKQHFIERIMEATPDILYIFDVVKNTLVYANKKLKQLLGYSPDEIRQMGAAIYQKIFHPDDLAVIAANRAQGGKVEDGQLINIDLRVKHADGQWLWLNTRSVVFSRDSEGFITQVLGSARDITEKKQAEQERESLIEELKKSNMDLAAVNKELEAYSYTISHDLRAPLRSIEGFSTAIMEDYADKLDATGRDYFLRVTSASHRMSQLIDALLTMSRLTQSEIKEKVINLSDTVRVIAHELNQSQPERAVEFVIAERVFANGDPDMLRIVLENLLNNSWKFTSRHPAARIEFGITRIDDKDVYFVRDDGAGFNMKFADKLFNPFRRFHTEAEFIGLGMGMATAHKIIKRHGGKIWAESAPEKGATFYFTL